MTRDVMMVGPECPLRDVASLLSEHGIGGLPVIDGEGSPLGVVSNADIVIKEWAEVPASRGRWRLFGRDEARAAAALKVKARTAGEAMSSPAITIDGWLPLSLAAERMLAYGVNRLLILRQGKVAGIIARHDLVAAFARSDAEIEREIREDAARELASPNAIQVSVSDGEVTLRGEVDSVADAEALPVIIRHVPGVISVDSELRGWDQTHKQHVEVAAQL